MPHLLVKAIYPTLYLLYHLRIGLIELLLLKIINLPLQFFHLRLEESVLDIHLLVD